MTLTCMCMMNVHKCNYCFYSACLVVTMVILYLVLTRCSQEIEEARAALHVQSASFEQLQNQLKEMQEQLGNEEKAREHARKLQRSVTIVLYRETCEFVQNVH